MKPWRRRPRCLGLLGAFFVVLALFGCSSLRLGYGQGSTLAYWWLDRYVDFDRQQTPAVKQALTRWFDWHRQTQLGEDIRLLEQAAQEVERDATAAQACDWLGVLQLRRDTYLRQALPAIAELAPQLHDDQLQHLRDYFQHQNEDWREEHLSADPVRQQRAAADQVIERAEMLYRRLDRTQRLYVAERTRSSPWDPQRWLQDRQRRQADMVDTLRLLAGTEMSPSQRQDTLRAWLERLAHPSENGNSGHMDELVRYQCAFAADLHNRTSAAQRRQAQQVLRGWAQDLRSFAPVRTTTAGSP
jgi:hypothetical protein